jgi:serine/threonine protein phosphatase 1
LIKRHQTGRLVALRGNHDLMMLDVRDNPLSMEDWLVCGGGETLSSYAQPGHPGRIEDVPAVHWAFLESVCVDWYETETHFFVHANAHPDLSLVEQPGFLLYWEPLDDPKPHCSGKIMVCGHTKQRSGEPLNLGHTICIDTWVYGQGWLTCLDVGSGCVWQANQLGQQRVTRLSDPRKSR